MQTYDLVAHLLRQRAFSRATFGPGARAQGIIDHIRKELIEIEKAPGDITEWVDVVLLGLDGLWRCAESRNPVAPIEYAVGAIAAKQTKNEVRDWPDWRTAEPNKAIEHVRTRAIPRRDADAPMVPPHAGCVYEACPSPYVCKSGCKFVALDPDTADVGGGP